MARVSSCAGALAPVVAVVLSACVAEPIESNRLVVEDETQRPVGIYVVTDEPNRPSEVEMAFTAAAPGSRIIFLNGRGGTYRPGYNDASTNTSSIVDRTSTIPAYEGSASEWSALLSCVRDLFAAYDVVVTDEDPGSVPHVEAVMGGQPGHAGMPSGVGGVAPMNGDCSIVEEAIVYVFTQVLGDVRTQCEVAGQEIAHAYGLDHELLCSDPMTYLSPCGAKRFRDENARCGEYSARRCMCGDSTQNSHRILLARLGVNDGTMPPTDPTMDPGGGMDPTMPPPADAMPPAITIESPADGATLPANSSVEIRATIVDDVGVSRAELVWNYSGRTIAMDCAAPPAGASCTPSGDTYTWRFPVGTGSRSFIVRARDAAGHVTESAPRNLTFGDAAPPPTTMPPPSSAPTATIDAPVAGTTISPGDYVMVRVTANDDSRVTQVWLEWVAPTGSSVFPLVEIGGGEWGIDLSLSPYATRGTPRTLRATAFDDAGNRSTPAEVVIQVR